MARLILTDEEQASASFLDWDDESLGKLVRKIALTIADASETKGASVTATASLLLVHAVLDNGADHLRLDMGGVTVHNGQEVGDWVLDLRRKDAGSALETLFDADALADMVREEARNRDDDDGVFVGWTPRDWEIARAWEAEILDGLRTVIETLTEEGVSRRKQGTGKENLRDVLTRMAKAASEGKETSR